MGGWLPPGCTDRDIDEAALGYDQNQLEQDVERICGEIDKMQGIIGDMSEVLMECLEYFEDREDADHDGTRFIANKEMRLSIWIRRVLAKVGAGKE